MRWRSDQEVATEHDIPIVENVALARALYATVEIDDKSGRHYHAVAEIIGYSWGSSAASPAAGVRRCGGVGCRKAAYSRD